MTELVLKLSPKHLAMLRHALEMDLIRTGLAIDKPASSPQAHEDLRDRYKTVSELIDMLPTSGH